APQPAQTAGRNGAVPVKPHSKTTPPGRPCGAPGAIVFFKTYFYNVRRGQDPPCRFAAGICFARLPAVPGRFVGAACMRPAGVCITATFLVVYAIPSFVGEAYMPPGRGEPSHGVYG